MTFFYDEGGRGIVYLKDHTVYPIDVRADWHGMHRFLIHWDKPNRKGEKLLMEFSFSLWGDNAKVWNLWVKKGWIERKKSLIHLSVQVDCPDGMACSRYNPQHTRDGKVDFNWMLDISDESLKALVEETVRRFMEAA